MHQKTINRAVEFSGVGLHSGGMTRVTLSPMPQNTGIRFYKVVNGKDIEIPLSPSSVTDTQLCSAISHNGASIKTIEHFMAALFLLGIDNIGVYVDGDEMPIMDGSSLPFIMVLREAGIKELSAPKRFIRIAKRLTISLDDKYIVAEPHHKFSMDFNIDFEHQFIQGTPQKIVTDFSDESIIKNISRSRTFGFLREIEYLQSIGLAKGGSLDNAIVLNEFGIMNKEPLRNDSEFLYHKILDSFGDLYIAGLPILGKFTCYKTGHMLNNMIVREILAHNSNYEIVESNIKAEVPELNRQLAWL